MDHFPVPQGAVSVDVPYLGGGEYDPREFLKDGASFMEYPKRKGWTEAQLLGVPDFGPRPSSEVEAFFQTWLYFGTLFRVFRAAAITLTLEDFIRDGLDGKKYVTTKTLPRAIKEFVNSQTYSAGMDPEDKGDEIEGWGTDGEGEGSDGDNDVENSGGAVAQVSSILEKVYFFAGRYCGEKSYFDPVHNVSIPSPLSPEVSTSIIALGTTLHEVARNFYRSWEFPFYQQHKWPVGLLLRERLQNAGWCPRDVSQFEADFYIDSHYYFSSIVSPRKDQDHSRCTVGTCYGGNVDPTSYRTTHARKHSDPSNCEHVEAQGIATIIKDKGIPLVRWRVGAKNKPASLEVIKYDGRMKYVAISHVY